MVSALGLHMTDVMIGGGLWTEQMNLCLRNTQACIWLVPVTHNPGGRGHQAR